MARSPGAGALFDFAINQGSVGSWQQAPLKRRVNPYPADGAEPRSTTPAKSRPGVRGRMVPSMAPAMFLDVARIDGSSRHPDDGESVARYRIGNVGQPKTDGPPKVSERKAR